MLKHATLPRLVAIESRNQLYYSQRPLVIVLFSQPGSGIPFSKINNTSTKSRHGL